MADSRAAAEDSVQEALARAWERSDRGERIENLKAWVTTVAMNLARSRLRRLATERRARSRVSAIEPSPAPESAADLERALRSLPRRQREVVVLHYYLQMSVAEVAQVLEIAEGTVKTSLHRARNALAAMLGDAEQEEEHAGL